MDALTSLRFIAAFSIVFMHAEGLLSNGYPSYLSHLAWEQGVSFFFVLSGFILLYNYPVLDNKASETKYFVARIARIWPAYITVFALILLTSSQAREVPWSILTPTVLMLNSLVPNLHYCMNVNPPAWSVSTEFCFYLIFPLLVANFKNTWWWKLSISGAIVVLSIALAAVCNTDTAKVFFAGSILGDFFSHCFLYMNPIVRVFEFMIGMFTALAFMRFKDEWHSSNGRINALQVASVLTVILSFIVCSALTPLEQSPAVPNAFAHWLRSSGCFLADAFLIFSMAFGEGIFARAISSKAWVTLGEISYSFYLVHFPVIWLILVHKCDWFKAVPDLLLYSLSMLFILIAAWLLYTLIENPARKAIPKMVFGAK